MSFVVLRVSEPRDGFQLYVQIGIYLSWAEDGTNGDLNEFQDGRILNGTPVNPPHSRPYIVLFSKDLSSTEREGYVGVIYDEWTILTFDDDIQKVSKVFAGKYYYLNKTEDSQQERKVCSYSKHPKRDSAGAYTFRYGIIHLGEPLTFNEYVQPGKFPLFDGKEGYPTENCKVAGWGRITPGTGADYSEVLREAPVRILPIKACDSSHNSLLCVSEGASRWDWGSPVTCRGNGKQDVIIGIIVGVFVSRGNSRAISLPFLPKQWFDKEIETAVKKCRGNQPPPPPPPPPPPNDCCSNGDTINGDPAIPHSRPFIVQIHMENSKQVAIGVLINAYTIVTSAQQIDNVRKISAGKHLFGKYEGTQQTRTPCTISKHPNIGKPENAFDYGLIHLADPFAFNEYVNAISLAPSGDKPKEECSIIAWQQTLLDTELREQKVKFKDPSTCKNVHETITCVEAGACLHDWGSPVICSHDSKIFFHAIVSSANSYCKDAILSSIAELPRSWLATELRNAETKCGKSVR